ncbi:MAG: hypothetical protein KDD60_01620 [Bdellovibrionales bacterium]|nr:hypothetical protein [Bdellovibrionales bacterium]
MKHQSGLLQHAHDALEANDFVHEVHYSTLRADLSPYGGNGVTVTHAASNDLVRTMAACLIENRLFTIFHLQGSPSQSFFVGQIAQDETLWIQQNLSRQENLQHHFPPQSELNEVSFFDEEKVRIAEIETRLQQDITEIEVSNGTHAIECCVDSDQSGLHAFATAIPDRQLAIEIQKQIIINFPEFALCLRGKNTDDSWSVLALEKVPAS